MYVALLPYGVKGIPDFVDCTDGKKTIVVEKKFVQKLPGRVWADHEVQVVAYALSLEWLGFESPYGIVEYAQRDNSENKKQIKVQVDDYLRDKVRKTAESIRRILDGTEEPIPPKFQAKCERCDPRYKAVCKWKLC